MYAVGVDASKSKSTVAVLRSKTEIVVHPLDVEHNAQGLASLAKRFIVK